MFFQNSVCLRAKLWTVCGVLAVGLVGYVTVEFMEQRAMRKKEDDGIGAAKTAEDVQQETGY